MKQRFYSNGKLFITGEYLVLDGAKAFALPTKFGQDLVAEPNDTKTIRWTSFDADGTVWFETEVLLEDIRENRHTGTAVADTLVDILHAAIQMNPNFLASEGFLVTTHLTFPRSWGLGTSSTLVNNIAQWAQVDAYELLWKSFGGSGYDIACAQHDSAVIFQRTDAKPVVKTIDFHPSFSNSLYFVYLNKKQNSKTAIANYRNKKANLGDAVLRANAIADTIVKTIDANGFAAQLDAYESLLAPILETPTAKQQLFPDFNGTVKSLGAWGGDFVLAVSTKDPTAYFQSKGYDTVIRFDDMVLRKQ